MCLGFSALTDSRREPLLAALSDTITLLPPASGWGQAPGSGRSAEGVRCSLSEAGALRRG